MSEESRSTLIFILWLFTAVVLVALFISAASQRELTAGHLAFASALLAIAAAGTPYIMRQPIIGEKPKRRVDASTTSATTTCSNSNAACPTSVKTKRRSPIISATMANSSAAGNARRGGSEKLLISVGLALCKGTACRAPIRPPYIPTSTREISKASTGCPVNNSSKCA
jgi:hypothetical protein